MRKLLCFLLCLSCAIQIFAEYLEIKDVPYYKENSYKVGNEEYLNERCKLDFYYPDDKTNYPVVIWLHGGGLSSGFKTIPEALKNRGIGVVAVNYRLSGDKAQAPDFIYDSAAAVAWTLENVARYGGNPEQVYLCGHSAGGYLAAMVALDNKYLAAYGSENMKLAGVFPVSGQMTTHFRVVGDRRKNNPSEEALQIDDLAPLRHAKPKTPPITLIVGDPAIEWPARVEENAFLYAYLTKVSKNPNIKYYSLPGFDHGTVLSPALQLMVNQINANQPKPETKK